MPARVGVLAVIATPAPTLPAPARFHVLLDDLQDPGNVGTILRTAAAAGVEQVLLSKHCAFAWSPKVLRAGQGAHFLTTIVEDVDLSAGPGIFERAAARCSRLPQVAAAISTTRGCASAGRWRSATKAPGSRRQLAAQADVTVAIPMHGGMESLNAAAAAAVVLFELVRRRRG